MPTSIEEALADSRQLLPAWVVWSHVLTYLLMAAVVAGLGSSVSAFLASSARRIKAAENWVQRARLAYPARAVAGTNIWVMTVVMAGGTLALGWPFSVGLRIALGITAALVAFAAASWVAMYVERRVLGAALSKKYFWQSLLAVNLCYRPHVFFVLILLFVLPSQFDLLATIIVAVAVVPYAFFAVGGGLFLAHALGLAKPASGRLLTIVERASREIGMPPPRTYELRWYTANAFAFPIVRRLAFTDRAVGELSDDDLQAICLHELGHLSESWPVLAARLAGPAVFFPLACIRPLTGSYGLGAYLTVIVAVLVAVILLRRMGRRMEVRADRVAVRHEADSGLYARALERLYEINLIPVTVWSKRTVHPSLYDRLVAAGVTPSYPRPKPPSRLKFYGALYASILLTVLCVVFWWISPVFVLQSSASEATLQWSTAIWFGAMNDAETLAYLAHHRSGRGDDESAAVFLRAASTLDGESWHHPTNLAITLARIGDCERAESVLNEAVDRYERYESPPMVPHRSHPSAADDSDEPDIIQVARILIEICRNTRQ